MILTEYEKEVIYRALDNYIALLGSKGDSKTAYEIKTAKEIRTALDGKSLHTVKKQINDGYIPFSAYKDTGVT